MIHFTADEMKCKCKITDCLGKTTPPKQELLDLLEEIRDHFKVPVAITSAVRCDAHNLDEGGKIDSRHRWIHADAADIKVAGFTPDVVYAWCDQHIGNRGGVGRYDTFTHVDTRGERARWDYRKKKGVTI